MKNKIQTYLEEREKLFREKFIKEPLKEEGGQFGWSRQDCGGAEMIIDFNQETTEGLLRIVGEMCEGMRRGACCDCQPEKGYKCYHAGREDVIDAILQAIIGEE